MNSPYDRTTPFDSSSERGRFRAADADRERVVEILKGAYSEGRLSKDEYDSRVEAALSGRTYADLDLLVSDLPAGRMTMAPPVVNPPVARPAAKINSLAIASLACGLAQLGFGPLGTIPAIVFGHMARHQIRRTGERGSGLALAGLMLGWGAVALGIIIVAIAIAAVQSHPMAPVHGYPGYPFQRMP